MPLKSEFIEAKGSFSFQGYKKVTSDSKYIYFKLIEPITFEEAKAILEIDPDAKSLDKESSDILSAKIWDAVEAVDVVGRSFHKDPEYGQVVDTCRRPHMKYDCVYFRDRMAPSRNDAVRNVVMSAVQEGGSAPVLRPFYNINKSAYAKEIADVVKIREKRGKDANEYFNHAKNTTPGLENEPDAEKIDKMALAGMSHLKKGDNEYGLQDPDTPVSVYTDKAQIESVRMIRSQLKSRNRSR